MHRTTLHRAVTRVGVGVHSGAPCTVTLRPAPFGGGIVFEVDGARIPAISRHAAAGEGCTRLAGPGVAVSTPEHLLAALHGLGVTDVTVHVEGPEVPILDGSAQPWLQAIDEAGRRPGPRVTPLGLPSVRVEASGGWAEAGPGPDVLAVEVDFGPGGPAGSRSVLRNEAGIRQVGGARSFVRSVDIERLRAAGRGRGATPENTVIWPSSKKDLRSPDEPVLHKLVDAWGDLALLGPFSGQVRVVRGSHALHHALLTAILGVQG